MKPGDKVRATCDITDASGKQLCRKGGVLQVVEIDERHQFRVWVKFGKREFGVMESEIERVPK